MLYNNMMVEKENSLSPDIERINKEIKSYSGKNQFDSVAVASKELVAIMDKKIAEIDAARMPSAVGVETFKKTYLAYFQFMKGVYVAYIKIGEAKTDADRHEEQAKMMTIINGIKKEIVKLQTAQRKFASENDFSLNSK